MQNSFNNASQSNTLQSLNMAEDDCLVFNQIDKLSNKDIVLISIELGFRSVGGPEAQINLIKEKMVGNNYISQKYFNNFLELFRYLPGFSTANFLSSIVTINKHSIFEGALSLILFNSPSLIAILFITPFMNLIKNGIRPKISNFNPDAKYFSLHDEAFLYCLMASSAGLVQAALGLLFGEALNLSKKLSFPQLSILLISGIIYYFFDKFYICVITMLISGLITIIIGDNYIYSLSQIKMDEIKYTGVISIIVFMIVFTTIVVLSLIFENNKYLFLAESFIKIGIISVGEGHVIIPLIFSIFQDYMEESEVLNGYALISLLPGSLLNIAAYSGVILSNILGGLISGLIIFFPGFMFTMSAFPYITKIEKSAKFQYFIRGANSSAIGFMFSVILKLWIDSCFVNKYTNKIIGSVNVIFCFIISLFNVHKTIILIVGALLNIVEEIIEYIIKTKSLDISLY